MKFASRIFILPLVLLFACNQPSGEGSKVIGVKDGDTIVILLNGTSETIRLAEIDCPEKAQPFGQVAKKFTSSLCFGKNVKVVPHGKRDQYGRIVGTVYINDTLVLNKELLKAGLAWHYKQYSQNEEYAQLENTARELQLGLWQDKHPTPPWSWRRKKKHQSTEEPEVEKEQPEEVTE
jgi:micrococcal nuclease